MGEPKLNHLRTTRYEPMARPGRTRGHTVLWHPRRALACPVHQRAILQSARTSVARTPRGVARPAGAPARAKGRF